VVHVTLPPSDGFNLAGFRRHFMGNFAEFHQRSINDRDAFWAEQAKLVDWKVQPQQICDYSNPPFAKWFVGGETNLCHNAVDRHLAERADQPALIFVSTETDTEKTYTYRDLHAEVQRMAAILQDLGVVKGDRVLDLHAHDRRSGVCHAGLRALGCHPFGGVWRFCLALAGHPHRRRFAQSHHQRRRGFAQGQGRGLQAAAGRSDPAFGPQARQGDHGGPASGRFHACGRRDVDYATERAKHMDAVVPCVWVESTHPSYTLYTSGTTGKPKGVQRDTGGYTVALAASMPHVFEGKPGGTFSAPATSVGWWATVTSFMAR
jgi:propionyl-CoA synthetase